MAKPSESPAWRITPAVLFIAAGAFWVAIAALGGGAFLLWPAATSLLSGVLLLTVPTNRVTGPLFAASGLFGAVLTFYQLYIGLTDVGTFLGTVALYNTVPFAAVLVLYAYLLIFAFPKN